MHILTIEYRKLVNLGNYENMTVGATAAVKVGDDITEAFITLRQHVDSEAAIKHRPSSPPPVEENELDEIPF